MNHDLLTRLPYLIAAFLPALTFHEWAHAVVAYRFGDTTALRQGRLTLNPFAHLDPMGTIAIMLVGFGWARPVPIDARNFRHPWAEFWVAAAGPLMNFTLAIVFAILFRAGASSWLGPNKVEVVSTILFISIQLNLALAFFNLIPIGPLDGNHLLAKLLPHGASLKFSQWNAQYGSLVLFGAILIEMVLHIGILTILVGVPVQFVERLLLS
ncbi:MAG: ywhC [Bacteriovoracaceae bacterium]|nr:ywhC [Bacteriovoracaceae bacterium]